MTKTEHTRRLFLDKEKQRHLIHTTGENAAMILNGVTVGDLLSLDLPEYELRKSLFFLSQTGQHPVDTEATFTQFQSSEWVSQRALLHDTLLADQMDAIRTISSQMDNSVPTIYIVAGNIASGKSTLLRTDKFFSKYYKNSHTGIAGADPFKKALQENDIQQDGVRLPQARYHIESIVLRNMLMDLLRQEQGLSFTLDKTCVTLKNINDLIQFAEVTGRRIELIDIVTDLEDSLIRVLARDGFNDPISPLDLIKRGSTTLKQRIPIVIEQLFSSDCPIDAYRLLGYDEKGTRKVAYEYNRRKKQHLAYTDLFRRVLSADRPDTENIMITPEYIESKVRTMPNDSREQMRISLGRFLGRTLQEALDIRQKEKI